MVLEEVAASGAAMNGCSAVHLSIFGMHPVVLHGSEEMRRRYLPRVAKGDLHVAFGVTEPDAGTDTPAIKTRAFRQPDGSYRIRGRKVWTSKALEAERVLLDSRVHGDAVLQFALAQTLSALPDPDGSRLSRAETAFRRAAELDATWAQPRARLGALLWRQGKRAEARTQFDAALKLDPTCPEALAVLSAPRPRAPAFAVSAAVSVLAAAAVVLAFRPSQRAKAPSDAPAISAASVAPAPQAPRPTAAPASRPPAAAAVALRLPEPSPVAATAPPPRPTTAPAPAPKTQSRTADRTPEPDVEREPEPAPRTEPRKKKVAAASGSRAAAEAESARGDKSLRAFDTKGAETAFAAALQLDPTLPSAHRGMGMVYVLLGRNSEAKSEYSRYLQLAPDAPDREQIARLLAR